MEHKMYKLISGTIGRRPWSRGCSETKWDIIVNTIRNPELMDLLKNNCSLPRRGICI